MSSRRVTRSVRLPLVALLALVAVLSSMPAVAKPSGSGICTGDPTVGCWDDQDCVDKLTTGPCLLPTTGGELILAPDNPLGCMQDVWQDSGKTSNLTCTAEDISIYAIHDLVVVDPCTYEGDTGVISFVAEYLLTAQARHDVGVYIAADGGDALTGECSAGNFPAYPGPPWTDLDTRAGTCTGNANLGCDGGDPGNSICWDVVGADQTACDLDPTAPEGTTQLTCSNLRTVECSDPDGGNPDVNVCNFGDCDTNTPFVDDVCGDIDPVVNPIYHQFDSVPITCVDADGDGFADVNACLSWRQPGANELCTGPLDSFPGAPSKCKCDILPGPPITAVDLVSFTAAAQDHDILVEWQTGSEIDNLGFNLYRALSSAGARAQLNDSLIPTAQPPGSPFGASYTWLDEDVAAGITYYYWLEDVDLAGVATLHGPVTALIEPATVDDPSELPGDDPAAPPAETPFVPEASTLLLLGSAASGLAGYVGLQIRARRRR